MDSAREYLSVTECARHCGVARSTINHWIGSDKIRAIRSGRRNLIPVSEILHFLRNSGRSVPPSLSNQRTRSPDFTGFPSCWEYWGCGKKGDGCKDCMVFARELKPCFEAKANGRERRAPSCGACEYYRRKVLPHLRFLDPFECPAAAFRNLTLWGGNEAMARLLGLPRPDLPGCGVEGLFKPESLCTLLSRIKDLQVGEGPGKPARLEFKRCDGGFRKASVSLFPIQAPVEAIVMFCDSDTIPSW